MHCLEPSLQACASPPDVQGSTSLEQSLEVSGSQLATLELDLESQH